MKIFRILAIVLIISACKKSGSGNNNGGGNNPPPPASFVKGADVNWLTQMEASNKKFYNSNSVEQDCLLILKNLGMNTIRLRV